VVFKFLEIWFVEGFYRFSIYKVAYLSLSVSKKASFRTLINKSEEIGSSCDLDFGNGIKYFKNF